MKRDHSQILIETNTRLNKEMIELYFDISSLIQKAEPIELVEELALRMILSNDFSGNPNAFLTLSQLEFIIGLVLNREQDADVIKKPLNSREISTLASKVEKYFINWTFTYHFKKQNVAFSQNDAEKERDRLISSLVTHHSTVRGDTYYAQEKYQLLALFTPFKEWMDIHLGFNIKDAMLFIHRITELYTARVEQFIESCSKNTNKNSSSGHSLHINREQQFPSPVKELLLFREADILGTDTNYSDRFNSFLDCFSSVYRQTFNENFKFPSDTNIFRSKPIFNYHQKLIVPSPSSLMWGIQSVIENEMKNDSVQWEKYQRLKGKYLESEAAIQFKKIFPKARIHQSLFFTIPENGEHKTYELDGIVIYDTNIILVESKSGIFSENARKRGVKRLERIIKDNIEKAFEQAYRARDFITNSELPIFYDEKGNELLRLEKANYYRIFLVNLTLHNFGEIATMLQRFRKAELYRYDEYPLSINLNDLKIMAENISFPSQFLHYIHRRIILNNKISNQSTIMTTDELDLFAHYFETNLFYDNEKEYDVIYIPNYAPDFNERYLSKLMGMSIPPLEQNLNPQFKKIILDLEDLGQFGFSNIIINLLDLSSEARDTIMKYLDIISKKTYADGKFHDFSTAVLNNPKDPKSGVGITFKTGLLKDRQEMAKQLFAHCQLKKNQQRCYEWIGIGRYVDSTRWFVDEAVYMRYEENYDERLSRLASENLRGSEIIFKKVGRNDPCPCGSGTKYKKCHGRLIT